ncbi:MAG: KdsC family phosphatase [Agathobacter sp.]
MIKYLIMDVDGTLTDGKIYMGSDGEAFKAFDVKDGCGIKDILPLYGIKPVIITARESKMLEKRCKELSIEMLFQGERDKIGRLNFILEKTNSRLGDCAYIGDDILDIQCIIPIKEAGGKIGCPADAVKKVKDIADFISTKNGGDGAVREFIEWLVDGILPGTTLGSGSAPYKGLK